MSKVRCEPPRPLIGAMLLALLVAPWATAQEPPEDVVQDILATPGTPITFYGHLYSHNRNNPMPMNTQFPDGEEDYSIGVAGGCGNKPPLPDNSAGCEAWGENEEYFYTTAGFVQAKNREEFINKGGYEMLHNERGQTKDVYIDTSMPLESVFHMSADFHGWLVAACVYVCWNWDPGLFEDWVIEAWLWHVPLGEHGSGASDRPDMGPVADRSAPGLQLMANGASEPRDMISFDETLPLEAVCGGPCQTVHEFVIPMEWDPSFDGVIPREADFVLEFEWYQLTDGQKYIQQTPAVGIVWNVNGGEDYPNRMTLPVRNPLDVEVVYPAFLHDKLVILSVINTPWGSYDIDRDATKLTVRDAAGNVVPIQDGAMTGGLDVSVSHAGHYLPIEGQWVWDYQAQGLAPGEYTVEIEATNFQHSFTTSTTATFAIDAAGLGVATDTGRSGLSSLQKDLEVAQPGAKDVLTDPAAKESPGPQAAVVAALAVAVLAAGRRGRQ